MTNFCAEHHHHKFHPSHQLFSSKKPLRDIDIPPRKQLLRRSAGPPSASNLHDTAADNLFSDETLLQKFLPYNGNPDDDDSDPYSSDHFRIFEFKVRRCTRSRSHDWTDCPFAHPGEKARRRDPRKYQYAGTVCPDYRRGGCSRGDGCEFAHGVFECWLHPARYRTEACKDGKNCKRKVCFFAHSPRQLRILSSPQEMSPEMSPVAGEKKYRNSSSQNHCCLLCHHCGAASSPTSTLMGISHLSPPLSPSQSQSLSPPLSPLKHQHRSARGFSPISRYNDRYPIAESNNLSQFRAGLSYKNVLTELMSSLEAMNFNEASPISGVPNRNFPGIDVSQLEDQQQFILSPSTTNPDSSEKYFGGNCSSRSLSTEEMKLSDNGFSSSDPDLGWVNDLLM